MHTPPMKFLSLNCQRAHRPTVQGFLKEKIESEIYDVLILQEVTDQMEVYVNHPAYQHIRVSEEELCIVYRKSFRLLHHGVKTFPCTHSKTPFGILWANLETNMGIMRMVSVHLYAGINIQVRLEQTRITKELLSKESVVPTVIAGDFNTGFFRESYNVANILSPEFDWVTKDIGPTLNTRYTENAPYLANRIAAFLAFFKIGIKLRTDHMFIDNDMAQKYTITYRVLPDRVSDHSAVECIMSPMITPDEYLKKIFSKGNNPITDQYYTDQDFEDLDNAKSFTDVYIVVQRALERMPLGLIQVCGPISNKGFEGIPENIKRMDIVIKDLQKKGWNIFDQMYVEGPFQRIRWSEEYKSRDGHGDILKDFYLPLFQSGKIKGLHFMKDWESSKGAQWEHDRGVELGMEITYE